MSTAWRIRGVENSIYAFSDISNIPAVQNMVSDPVYSDIEYLGITYYFLTYPHFLMELESQQTGKIKRFNNYDATGSSGINCGVNLNHAERYIYLRYYYNQTGVEDLTSSTKAIVNIGVADFPLGYYNLKIYEMEERGDFDPDNALSTLLTTQVVMYPNSVVGTDYFLQVDYKEYTNNNTDNNSVYVTYG
tara:strand:- start:24928 stop:25497 length:570 start_codon:yes stop_codon:yes gene_type:complete